MTTDHRPGEPERRRTWPDRQRAGVFRVAAAVAMFSGSGAAAQTCPPEEIFQQFELVRHGSPGNSALRIADIDGDGDLDAVFLNGPADELVLHRGDGTGSLSAVPERTPLTFGPVADGLTLFDLDGDGDLDIVAPDVGDDRVAVLLNDGDGGFEEAAGSPAGDLANVWPELSVGDVDGDGHADVLILAAPGSNRPISVLSGDGAGGFTVVGSIPNPYPPNLFPVEVLVLEEGRDPAIAVTVVSFGGVLGRFGIWRRAGPGGGNWELVREYQGPPQLISRPRLLDLDGDGEREMITNVSSTSKPRSFAILRREDGTWPIVATVDDVSPYANVVAEDIDGDLLPDLLVSGGLGLEVYWSDGTGTFSYTRGPSWSFPSGEIGVADLDGDGDFDVIGEQEGELVILRGRPGGDFASLRPVEVPGATVEPELGFLDIDETPGPEILIPRDGGVDALAGPRPGGQPPRIVASIELGPVDDGANAIGVADFDGDGVEDFVAGGGFPDGWVQVARRDPAGGFEALPLTELAGRIDSLVAMHLGGADDPLADVVVGGPEGLRLYTGLGDGTFDAGVPRPTSGAVAAMIRDDVDGDGWPDLLAIMTPQLGSRVIDVLRGTPSGAEGGLVRLASHELPSDTRYVTVADVDADGRADLIAVDDFSYEISVRLGDGSGDFILVETLSMTEGTLPHDIAVADFDRDGIVDLVIPDVRDLDTNGRVVAFAQGRGDGTFEPLVTFGIAQPIDEMFALDADGDGVPDVAAAKSSVDWVYIVNQCTFSPPIPVPAAGVAAQLDTGDLTGDGAPEIVAVLPDEAVLQAFINELDDPGAPLPWVTLDPQPAGQRPESVALGDVDGDGWLDAVVADDADGDDADALIVFLNAADGTGTLVSQGPLALPAGLVVGPRDLAVADFDGDGARDIAVSNDSGDGGSIVVLQNDGSGLAYTVLAELATTRGGGVLDPCDIDDDKDLDLAIAVPAANALQFFVNRGPGGDPGFDPGPVVPIEGEPVGLAVGDFDSDGRTDLVTANVDTGTLTIVRSTGPGTFEVLANLGFGASSVAVVSADFDQNGADDLAAITELPDVGASIRIRLKTNADPGNTSFEPPVDLVLDAEPVFLATEFFDADAFPDLATANNVDEGTGPGGGGDDPPTEAISVLLNDGVSTLLACQIDADGDGIVGFGDLIAMLAVWGPCAGACPFDLDGDGVVGPVDLAVLITDLWGVACDS